MGVRGPHHMVLVRAARVVLQVLLVQLVRMRATPVNKLSYFLLLIADVVGELGLLEPGR